MKVRHTGCHFPENCQTSRNLFLQRKSIAILEIRACPTNEVKKRENPHKPLCQYPVLQNQQEKQFCWVLYHHIAGPGLAAGPKIKPMKLGSRIRQFMKLKKKKKDQQWRARAEQENIPFDIKRKKMHSLQLPLTGYYLCFLNSPPKQYLQLCVVGVFHIFLHK